MSISSLTRLDLPIRLRRNRQSVAIRSMVQETRLHPSNFIAPFFLIEGENQKEPIAPMPGIHRLSIDLVIKEAKILHAEGVQAICLFPCIDASLRTFGAEEAWNQEGLLARAIREIKQAIPSLCIIADVALDPFTSHAHDGLVNDQGEVLNDETVECLIRMALMQAEAGLDFVAPSDMMDGRIGAIRKALDEVGHEKVGIISYSAKYASALYWPFRDALQTRPAFGDKKTYQMDPANIREALLETAQDEEEGDDDPDDE